MLLLSICSVFSAVSYADTIVAGQTILAKGNVQAINPESNEHRKLRRRSEVFNIDRIVTGADSKAQFNMSDGGLITLKENTEILISEYKFNETGSDSSAIIEVVSGGLRSISGLIKKSGGEYKVKTPVGSIGIRGTHFAVEVAGDDVLFAVFSGNIDVLLNNQETLSLGVNENFAFASVDRLGAVSLMTQAPEIISNGYAEKKRNSAMTPSKSPANKPPQTTRPSTGQRPLPSNQNAQSKGANQSENGLTTKTHELDTNIYTESEWQGIDAIPTAELIAQRTGELNYQNVIQSNSHSSVGATSDFTLNMVVDFDAASVPGGSLQFSDTEGEWFAAFGGLINEDKLDLNINFASHGNNLAEGKIVTAFSNGLDEITGGFKLNEVLKPDVNANGSFKVTP